MSTVSMTGFFSVFLAKKILAKNPYYDTTPMCKFSLRTESKSYGLFNGIQIVKNHISVEKLSVLILAIFSSTELTQASFPIKSLSANGNYMLLTSPVSKNS